MNAVTHALAHMAKLNQLHGMLKILHALKLTTSYVPPAKALGVFSGGNEFAGMLGEIQALDHEAGQPFLCSLVIGAKTGIPGPGYFANARKLGHKIAKNQTDEFAFWISQMTALGVPLPAVSQAAFKSTILPTAVGKMIPQQAAWVPPPEDDPMTLAADEDFPTV